MKKLLFVVFALFMSNAQAGFISITPDNTNPNVNDVVNVRIVLEDVAVDEEFTSFSIGFNFDSSIFEFVSGSVTSFFPDFDLFTFSGLDVGVLDAAAGLLTFTLFEDIVFPTVFSGGDFLIAQFDLLTIGGGDSTFALTPTSEIGAPFDPLDPLQVPTTVDFDAPAPVSVQAADVPEPGTIMMFALAMVGFVSFRKFAK
ncbi:PEP-CTERM sorting domain-containing protein [Alteromonadaceae bacterium M269]|nr:PEP-CTERM sorting domain-containing protein [Alteromonadaceae bacterium M269]